MGYVHTRPAPTTAPPTRRMSEAEYRKAQRERYAAMLRALTHRDFWTMWHAEAITGGPPYYWLWQAEIERRTLLRPAAGHAPTEGADILLRGV